MHRLVAFVLMQALVLSTATASSLHIHEYLGHDHPEHEHGPASHEHHRPAFAHPDRRAEGVGEDAAAMEAERCDPGRHAIALTLSCPYVPQVQIEIAELARLTVVAPTAGIRCGKPITDVRVHGPPFDLRAPSRAPPLIDLA